MTESSKGKFKGYNERLFLRSCDLGLNEAISFLVICCGSGKTGTVSKWSATAVEERSGVSWKNAKRAIDRLVENGILKLTEDSTKKRPIYSINGSANDNEIWLPNSFLEGVINKSTGDEMTSPLYRLRSIRSVDYLKVAVMLYKYQFLSSDGGIERELVHSKANLKYVATIGQFDFCTSGSDNLLLIDDNHSFFTDVNLDPDRFKCVFNWLIEQKIIIQTLYLFESEELTSELLYPSLGDRAIEVSLSYKSKEYIESIHQKWADQLSYTPIRSAFKKMNDEHNKIMDKVKSNLIITPIHRDNEDACLFWVYRMSYTPDTKPTGVWLSKIEKEVDKYSKMLELSS